MAGVEPVTAVASQTRPWVRYLARLLDIVFINVFVGIAIAIFAADVVLDSSFDLLMTVLAPLGWVFIEPLFLSAFGTTPGKCWLKTRVLSPTGKTLSFRHSLVRSLSVWWNGLGAGIPFVTLLTMIVAYKKLTREGATTWDRHGGSVVIHQPIGAGRVVALIMSLVVVFALVTIGNTM